MNRIMESKIALITGASRGIGKSIKEVLSKDGIEIISPNRNELDLSSSESIDKFLSQTSADIDIIINNAGILKVGEHNEFSSDDFHEILQVNVVAPFKIISGFVEKMKIHSFGRIVNISSVWGQKSKKGRTLYSSSKAALDALTRSLAIEFASYNILINSVAPGYIETDMLKQCNTEEELSIIRDTIPMKRFGKKIEIAELVRFLSSEDNSYITGQVFTIDGGYTCK
jgi:NAD(P)-dependent dehydrogenase (short-subunit alcohol dehydrogenase family)